jgi:hypothetical protein
MLLPEKFLWIPSQDQPFLSFRSINLASSSSVKRRRLLKDSRAGRVGLARVQARKGTVGLAKKSPLEASNDVWRGYALAMSSGSCSKLNFDTVAYLISDRFEFNETAHRPFLILCTHIGRRLVTAMEGMRKALPKLIWAARS